jgi:hypothetical protein
MLPSAQRDAVTFGDHQMVSKISSTPGGVRPRFIADAIRADNVRGGASAFG